MEKDIFELLKIKEIEYIEKGFQELINFNNHTDSFYIIYKKKKYYLEISGMLDKNILKVRINIERSKFLIGFLSGYSTYFGINSKNEITKDDNLAF